MAALLSSWKTNRLMLSEVWMKYWFWGDQTSVVLCKSRKHQWINKDFMAGRLKKEVTHFPWGCSKEISAVPILIKSKDCGWNCFSLPPAKPRTGLCDSLGDDTHLLRFDSICPLGSPWSFIITTNLLRLSINIIMVYFIIVVTSGDSFFASYKMLPEFFQTVMQIP